jgi:hypothetical protein
MKTKKLAMLGVCVLFVMSLFSSALVHAVDTKEAGEQSNVVIIEPDCQEEVVEQFQIWGTYAEAQFAYGPSWTYAVLGYDAAGGYFLCSRQKADGSFFYFGCYSL